MTSYMTNPSILDEGLLDDIDMIKDFMDEHDIPSKYYLITYNSTVEFDSDAISKDGYYSFFLNKEIDINNLPEFLKIENIPYAACYNDYEMTELVVPEPVRLIEARAFQNCVNLRSLTLSDSLEIIGKGSFSGCAELESVTIPASVSKVRDFAFAGCDNLREITFLGKVDKLEGCAFFSENIESIYVPDEYMDYYLEYFKNKAAYDPKFEKETKYSFLQDCVKPLSEKGMSGEANESYGLNGDRLILEGLVYRYGKEDILNAVKLL